jgi:hypothetical protein
MFPRRVPQVLVVVLPCARIRQSMGAAVFHRAADRSVPATESCGRLAARVLSITREQSRASAAAFASGVQVRAVAFESRRRPLR